MKWIIEHSLLCEITKFFDILWIKKFYKSGIYENKFNISEEVVPPAVAQFRIDRAKFLEMTKASKGITNREQNVGHVSYKILFKFKFQNSFSSKISKFEFEIYFVLCCSLL